MSSFGCIHCQQYYNPSTFYAPFCHICRFCNQLFFSDSTPVYNFNQHNQLHPQVDNYFITNNSSSNKTMCKAKSQISGIYVDKTEAIRIYLPGMIVPNGWSIVKSSNGSSFIKGPKISVPTPINY